MELLAVFAALVAALLTAVLLVFVVYSVYLVIVHRRYAHIPQPKGASFYFGHALIVRNTRKNGKFILDLANEWIMECGFVFVFWGLHRPIVFAVDQDSVKTLSTRQISKPLQKDLHYIFGERLIKNSLLTIQHYDDWKDRRRTLDQAFVRSYLRGLVPVYNSVAKRDLIEALREKADGTTQVPMKREFSRVSLQVISEVAFGADFERDPYVQSLAGKEGLTSLLNDVFEGLLIAQSIPFIKYLPFAGRKCATGIRKIRKIGRYCIELRMKSLNDRDKLPFDIMSQILSTAQKEKNIDIEDLIDEFLLFYIAGQETTSTLLSFTTGLLIEHPDILQRVREEIDEVVGDKTSVEADDLDKLTYLNQVLEESMRLFPPAAPTKMSPPEGLSLGGYDVPGGTDVLVMSYCTHRNPEYFDDPLKFDPSRFDPGQKRPNPYVYYPFGIGHRSCIGRVLAIMEAKVVMVHLLRTYNLSLPDGYQLKCAGDSALMQPLDLLPCRLSPR